MEIEYVDRYTEHGCQFYGNLGLIRYSNQVTNHEFGGAYNKGGLLEWNERAKALMQEHHPNAVVVLGIPDLVFRIPDEATVKE